MDTAKLTVVNFSHPITPYQLSQLERLANAEIDRVIDVPCQFNLREPIAPQVERVFDVVGLSDEEWRDPNLIVNLPGLSIAAALMITYLYEVRDPEPLPRLLRLRPVPGAVPPEFEVAELIYA